MKQRIISTLTVAALWLSLLAAVGTTPARAATVGDVDEAVAVLTGLGIVSGYSDGLYHPEDSLTRAQFCKLAILSEGHEAQVAGGAARSLFYDLPASNWAALYVNLAYEEGLMTGKGDGSFGPDETVTLDQAVTVCLRLLGYTQAEIGPFWPEDYLSKARQVGLLEGLTVQEGEGLDRGQAALLLYNLLRLPNAQGRTFGLGLGATYVEDVVLLDNDAQAADGKIHTAQVFAGGNLTWYTQGTPIDNNLVGRRGILLLDKTGNVKGFLPDDSVCKTVAVEKVTASAVTDTEGNSYTISASTPVIADDEKSTFAAIWYDLEGRKLTFHYAESGGITLVIAADSQYYEGTLLTGYYENATPNATAPSSITLLGHTFEVAEDAAGLSELAVGDKITVSLNGSGEILQAWSGTKKNTTVVAVLDSASRGTLTHISGLILSAEISNSTKAEELEGCLVRINPSGIGKCSVTALSGGTGQKLDIKNRTLGSLPLADNVKIYDQVGSAPVVEVELEDILTDTVTADKITYVGTNEKGEVDLLLLKNVTGDGYTYGIYRTSTASSGKEGNEEYSEWKTVAIESSTGTSAYCASIQSIWGNSFGGLAMTSGGKIAGFQSLNKAAEVFRSAFDGEEYVVLEGVRVPIADNVQVYNDDNNSWIDLATAKGYSDTMTVYYSGTLGGNAKVRVIVVGD